MTCSVAASLGLIPSAPVISLSTAATRLLGSGSAINVAYGSAAPLSLSPCRTSGKLVPVARPWLTCTATVTRFSILCCLHAASQLNCAVTAYDRQDGDLSASVTVVPTVQCPDATSGTCVACSLASLQAGQCFPARWVSGSASAQPVMSLRLMQSTVDSAQVPAHILCHRLLGHSSCAPHPECDYLRIWAGTCQPSADEPSSQCISCGSMGSRHTPNKLQRQCCPALSGGQLLVSMADHSRAQHCRGRGSHNCL